MFFGLVTSRGRRRRSSTTGRATGMRRCSMTSQIRSPTRRRNSVLSTTSTIATVMTFLAHVNGKTMNGGLYNISNAREDSETAFDTTYNGKEFFDVYSPVIRSTYGQVYWKMMEEVPLPKNIIDRFENGRVMAVVGYEIDQVRTNPDGLDVPVPITHAYNHHYAAWLANSRKVQMVKKTRDVSNKELGGMMDHGSNEYWSAEPIQQSAEEVQVEGSDNVEEQQQDVISLCHFFSEGNGGEMRLSYHGYASGYAQLIESPNVFHIQPMQIDTWNREEPTAAYRPGGPLPKSSRIPPSAGYSGLIECPCSDRLEKKWWPTYELCESDDGSIKNATECLDAVKTVASGSYYSLKVGNDDDRPSGCSLTQRDDGGIDVFWNTHGEMKSAPIEMSRMTEEIAASSSSEETAWIGSSNQERTVAFASAEVNVTITSQSPKDDESDSDSVGITIVGPSDRWFAVGFGSDTMCLNPIADECPEGGPYAIVINGAGNHGVQERKMAFHGPGDELESSISIESVSEEHGYLTIALTRPSKGLTERHFTFDTSPSTNIPIITARGCPGTDFPHQHCGHGPSHLTFLPVGIPQSVCFKEVVGSIGGNMFDKDCQPFPKSDLKDQENPTCTIQSYRGGLSCCRDSVPLLDKDQEIPWEDQVLEYHLIFRFYFEDYTERLQKLEGSVSNNPSHKNLVRLYWQTEARAGEYDIVQCTEGTPPSQCAQIITSRWKVTDMLSDCSIRNDASWCTGIGSTDKNKTKGVDLIYAAPHCHAPSCISMELYNADTGQRICRVEPVFGKSDNVYDERNFLALPPCIWGDEAEGLLPPPHLSLDTTLLSIKKNNSTLAITGEMASWQMRGVIVSTDDVVE